MKVDLASEDGKKVKLGELHLAYANTFLTNRAVYILAKVNGTQLCLFFGSSFLFLIVVCHDKLFVSEEGNYEPLCNDIVEGLPPAWGKA